MCDISSHTAGNNLIEQMTHLPLLYFSASVDSSAEVGNLFFFLIGPDWLGYKKQNAKDWQGKKTRDTQWWRVSTNVFIFCDPCYFTVILIPSQKRSVSTNKENLYLWAHGTTNTAKLVNYFPPRFFMGFILSETIRWFKHWALSYFET